MKIYPIFTVRQPVFAPKGVAFCDNEKTPREHVGECLVGEARNFASLNAKMPGLGG